MGGKGGIGTIDADYYGELTSWRSPDEFLGGVDSVWREMVADFKANPEVLKGETAEEGAARSIGEFIHPGCLDERVWGWFLKKEHWAGVRILWRKKRDRSIRDSQHFEEKALEQILPGKPGWDERLISHYAVGLENDDLSMSDEGKEYLENFFMSGRWKEVGKEEAHAALELWALSISDPRSDSVFTEIIRWERRINNNNEGILNLLLERNVGGEEMLDEVVLGAGSGATVQFMVGHPKAQKKHFYWAVSRAEAEGQVLVWDAIFSNTKDPEIKEAALKSILVTAPLNSMHIEWLIKEGCIKAADLKYLDRQGQTFKDLLNSTDREVRRIAIAAMPYLDIKSKGRRP